MTLEQAKQTLRKAGITLVKRDGEYHVYGKGKRANDVYTYFTDDLQDAVDTGLAVADTYRILSPV